jgi:hypothetical protein
MKLIKINTDHYIIVDDSEIKEGDWYIDDTKSIRQSITSDQSYWSKRKEYKKITHSTQPLEWFGGEIIFLSEVKELIGEGDVEKKAEKFIGCKYDDIEDSIDQIGYDSFIRGYNQAIEDNKEKKYTEEDLRKMFEMGIELSSFSDTDENKFKYALNHIQPKTEWEVEMVDGKLKLM